MPRKNKKLGGHGNRPGPVIVVPSRHHRHYYHPRYYQRPPPRRYYPRGGNFFLGMLAGGVTALATAAIIDIALDDARKQYKEETGEEMESCGPIPKEKYVNDKNGKWMCSETTDGNKICFYKNQLNDKENKACYVK